MRLLREALERARALYHTGELAQAEQLCRQVLRAGPDEADGWHLLGLACAAQGKWPEAADSFTRAHRLAPGHAEAHFQLGRALAALGRPQEAQASFERALGLDPGSAETRLHLGTALAEQRRLGEAAARFREALRLRPDHAEAHLRLAAALEGQGQLDEAEAHYRALLGLRPEHADGHNALGILLARQGRQEEALAHFAAVLRIDPGQARAHNNLGAGLCELGRPAEALAHFERAVELWPDYAEAHKSLGMLWLLQGDFARGWAEYEWRWRCQDFRPRAGPQPLWDGGPLGGKTVLLQAEQGIGDTIQFVRYAPLVKQRGGRVLLEGSRSLLPLLRTCPGVDACVPAGEAAPDFAVHLPLLSLPRVLGTTPATVPARVPYLAAEPDLVQRWRRELSCLGGLKVGLVWQGSPKNAADRRRSIPLGQFEPLARVEGVRLVSLQKGPGAEQLADVTGRFAVADYGSRLDVRTGAFQETAAALTNLDLLVSCDTAAAHLAGALAVPVWLALSFAADWRWLLGREDSAWYPTMRLFRQERLGEWGPVFARMAEALRQRVGQTPPAAAPGP
jgi:tetratricopeptide (TPR) repeat protein